jgi:hypothetical protein
MTCLQLPQKQAITARSRWTPELPLKDRRPGLRLAGTKEQMNLISITGDNLKGNTFTHELGRMNMIVGKNDAGKTSILDAICLSLLGYLPRLPRNNQGVFALSSSDIMRVCARFDNGLTVSRGWKQSGAKVQKLGEEGVDELGAIPVAVLDADAYLGASAATQVSMMFKLARVEFDRAEFVQQLTGQFADIADLSKLLEAKTDEEKENPQAWLDEAAVRVATALKAATDEVDRLAKTNEGISQIAEDDAVVNEGDVRQREAGLKALKEKLDTERGAINAMRQAANQAAASVEAWRNRVAELEAQGAGNPSRSVAVIESELAGLRQQERDAAEARTLAARREASITSKREAIQRDEAELARLKGNTESIPELEKALTAEMEAHETYERNVARMQELREVTAATEANLAAVRARNEELQNRRAKADAAECCPTCGADGENWKVDLLQRYDDEINANDIAITYYEKWLGDANSELASLIIDHSTTGRVREAELALSEARNSADNVPAYEGALEIKRQHLADLEAQQPTKVKSRDFQAEIEALEAEQRKAEAVEELARLKANPPATVEIGDIEGEWALNEAGLQEYNRLSAELEKDRQALAAQQSDRQRQQAALDKRTKAAAQVDSLKKLAKAIKARRTELVKEGFGPLLNTINTFTAGIVPTPIDYHKGSLGRWDGAQWITLKAFGGAYEAVTVAALQAALAALSPVKLLLMDELGNLDQDVKKAFLENVYKAITAGLLDQFIGIDPSGQDWSGYEDEVFRVIKVGGAHASH